jgi:phosphatidate cytidylyltransferase
MILAMLRWRLLLAVVIIAALAGLCWLDARAALPGLWLLPVAVALAGLASGEVLYLAGHAGLRPQPAIVLAANVLLVLAPWAPLACRQCGWHFDGAETTAALGPWAAGAVPLCVLAIGTLIVFLGEMRRYQRPGGITANIATAVFAMVYVGVMLGFAVQLRLAWGIGALVSWVIVVKMGDIGAYTVGRLIGRHKMAPILSPGKTVEGAFGALAFACLGSWAAFAWLVPAVSPATLPAGPSWGWFPFGLLLGGAGLLGDLAESLLKRDVGCKDSSRWLPGFGGVLDILDSLLLTAPIAWLCWLFGLVGR